MAIYTSGALGLSVILQHRVNESCEDVKRPNIRKLAHVPAPSVARPTAMETKSFMLSSKAMRLQVTLSKPVCPAATFPSSDRLPTSPCSCGPCPLAVTLCGEI